MLFLSMDNGFAQLRRALLEHIEQGRMYYDDLSTYTILHLKADPSKGYWFTNTSTMAAMFHKRSEWIRESLDRLESNSYIKRFSRPGQRTLYAVLINKFFLTLGPRCGYYINAIETKNYDDPILYLPEVDPRSTRGGPEVDPRSNKPKYRKIDYRLETIDKTRPQTSRALPTASQPKPQQKDGTEQRRRVLHRDRRLEREAIVRAEVMVGTGPELQRTAPPAPSSELVPPPAEFLEQLRALTKKVGSL
jgi:hypothetical protein